MLKITSREKDSQKKKRGPIAGTRLQATEPCKFSPRKY